MRPSDHPAAAGAAVLLCAYGCYSLWGAFEYWRWSFAVIGAAALLAGAGVLLGRRWAAYVTYAVVVVFIAGWGYAVLTAVRAGAWTGYRPLEAALTLAPGMALVALALLCAWVVRRFFSRALARSPQ